MNDIRRDDWILAGLALLLVIALVALPWFSLTFGPFSATLNGTDAPDGWLGVLAVIAALAVIADLGVERFSPQTVIPSVGGSREMTRFVLACAAAGFVALKFLFHISNTFKYLAFGFPVVVIATAGLVFFAMRERQTAPAPAMAAPASPAPGPAGSAGPPVS